MLEIKNVNVIFNKDTVNEKKALRDLNLKLNDGDFVTVINGPLKDTVGVIAEINENKRTVALDVDMLGRAKVEVDFANIKKK